MGWLNWRGMDLAGLDLAGLARVARDWSSPGQPARTALALALALALAGVADCTCTALGWRWTGFGRTGEALQTQACRTKTAKPARNSAKRNG